MIANHVPDSQATGSVLAGHLRVLVGGLDRARRCSSCRGVLVAREAGLCAECRSVIRVVFDAPDGAA